MRQRRSGVLLHPSSLPSPHGIGDLGPPALRFLDWLEAAGQTVWQILPLGPPGYGGSPYDAHSSFAGDPALLSPEAMAAAGLQAAAGAPVDPGRARAAKEELLRRAWESFGGAAPSGAAAELERFSTAPERASWLGDWCLYAALKARFAGEPWHRWPAPVRRRQPAALAAARRELADELGYQAFVQWLFHRQWSALREAARDRGILLFGDLPFYPAADSADVWSRPELFELDSDGRPLQVAGVPPDDFTPDGQRWGNPVYRWRELAADGYAWWLERVGAALRRVDLLRLDHFRGFAGYWSIPAAAETAAAGRWVRGPGERLFTALAGALGELPLVAEDLGVITAEVRRLRTRLGLPGMRVLQFGFAGDDSEHLPHRYARNLVVYTGTHDNDTTRGWFAGLDASGRRRVLDYLGGRPETVHRDLLRAAMTSVARLCVAPMQDLLGLGSEARLNTPGRQQGNWGWRLEASPDGDLAARLRRLAEISGRLPAAGAAPELS